MVRRMFWVLVTMMVFGLSTIVQSCPRDNQKQVQTQGQIGIVEGNNENHNLVYNGGNKVLNDIDNSSKSKSISKSNSESNAFGLGLGISGAKADPVQTVTVEGNTMIGAPVVFEDNSKSYSASYPTTQSTQDKEEKSIHSLFGGIGHNITERQVRIVNEMKTLERLVVIEVITEKEFKKEMRRLYKNLKRSNGKKKWFGVGPGGEGCHVWNGFGMFGWVW